MKKPVFFDLDGTLTDSGEGIMNCAEAAFRHLGMAVPERAELRRFVGPPLGEIFLRFGVSPEQLPEAITAFRARYSTVGKFENIPYPGIVAMLQKLHKLGIPMYVATSKPENMAVEIMEHFGLSPYFSRICGATWDSSRATKDQVIAYLLEQIGSAQGAIMVGDTVFDIQGAAAFGIPTVAVTWGYGDRSQMADAIALASTPEELLAILEEKTA